MRTKTTTELIVIYGEKKRVEDLADKEIYAWRIRITEGLLGSSIGREKDGSLFR